MAIDFSSFFGSNSSSGGFGSASWLNDYASIKNGSYRKLMKAYYSENGKESAKSKKAKTSNVLDDILAEKRKRQNMVETAESKAYTAVKSATDGLVKSIDKLSATGSASVFNKKDITTVGEDGLEMVQYDYDKEAIYDAVNDFVKNYNSVLSTSAATGNSTIANRVNGMGNETRNNQQALNQIGITIKADGSLSLDKDAFMKADMGKAKDLFGSGFYSKGLTNEAAMIKQNANYEQLRGNTYTYGGTYNSTNSVGTNYNNTL